MQSTSLHRITAIAVFVISTVQFLLTVQPSVPFWDPGELSAAAYMLQVPHPPGGPLFSLVGRVFFMIPFPGDIGLRMNLVSVFASSLSVLLLYLVAVKLIESYRGKEPRNSLDAMGTYFAAAIGALALSFSDSFWFSAAESNYFAASTLLFALVTWLMLVWNERADDPYNGKYILVMAYLVGLSAGVHLMSVLAIVAVVMVIVFRKFVADMRFCQKSGLLFLAHVAILMVIAAVLWAGQAGRDVPSMEESHAFDTKFKIAMVVASLLIMLLFRKRVFNKSSFYFPVLVGGVAVAVAYPGIIKLFPALLRAVAGNNSVEGLVVVIAVVGVLGLAARWCAKNKKPMLHMASLAVILAIIGFTTYAMIVIRSGKLPPMNENEPKSFSTLITYLNREQYGDFPIFKRRWSPEAHQQALYTKYPTDLDFFLRYQMNHMFTRYLMWNFVGRESVEQDAGVKFNVLYGIPFLLGITGVFFHFRKDWKMASVFLVLFIFMGLLIAFYQNQQEPQPRERDYFYPGAFFVFSVWIALGIRGLLDLIEKRFAGSRSMKPVFLSTLGLSLLVVPLSMLRANFHTHDRSKNWMPWDFSYNLLQSCDKDAILFTNGDNDTFPLWYLQDVEGIRRDVRIVNLSLGNTDWYIRQMKRKPYYAEAQAVPISIPDSRIGTLQPVVWEPRELSLPVSPEALKRFGVTDTSVLNQRKISFLMRNSIQFGDVKGIRVQDILVRDIIFTNDWKRPIYFAVTCTPDSKIGLDEYLWFHGLAYRLEPRRNVRDDMALDPDELHEQLFNEPEGFFKSLHRGFKFRGVADPAVFLDENASRLTYYYRVAFVRLAMYAMNSQSSNALGIAALERMEAVVPRAKYPLGWELASDVAMFYQRLGRRDRFEELVPEIELACQQLLESDRVNFNSYYNPYRILLDIYDVRKEYGKTLELLQKLAALYPNDPAIKQRIDAVQAQARAAHDTSGIHKETEKVEGVSGSERRKE